MPSVTLLINPRAYRDYRWLNPMNFEDVGRMVEQINNACARGDRQYLAQFPFLVIRRRGIPPKCLCWTCNRQKGPNRKARTPR